MSTLTTIQSTDLITNSRADINNNFSALNTDKMETSVLDTDTTLAANSDAKIPSQKAVKAYVDAGGQANASDTVKGIVEEATQAEVDAGTAVGATGARLYINPSTVGRRASTLIPLPHGLGTAVIGGPALSGNTTARVGQIVVPFYITVNKITIRNTGVSVAGTWDLSLYTEDGQTQLFSVTTASVSTPDIFYTTSVSSVALAPGIYYIVINPNSTAAASFSTWSTAGLPFGTVSGLLSDVTSEPVLTGTLTITADTPPTTFTPSSITEADNSTIICRLDN